MSYPPLLEEIVPYCYAFRETVLESYDLAMSVRELDGDIVECGIANGGQLAAMKLAAPEKLAWGYDSFEGIQLAGRYDEYQPGFEERLDPNRDLPENLLVSSGVTVCRRAGVEDNLKKWGFDLAGFKLVEGWVQHTLVKEENLPRKISILRLDMDIHDPTKLALEVLFPRLVPGGVLIIDDWEYTGIHRALDDYFQTVGYAPRWTTPTARFRAGYLYKTA